MLCVTVRPGSEGDIYLTATDQSLTRFANNRIHQNVAHQDAVAHVRVAIGKRQGRAVTNNLSADGLADAVRQAADYARLMPEDPDFPGLPEPSPARSVAAYHDATAACDAGQRAATVGMVCRKAAALTLDAAGFCRTGATELAVSQHLWRRRISRGFVLRPPHHRPQRRLGRLVQGRRLAHGRHSMPKRWLTRLSARRSEGAIRRIWNRAITQ